VLVWLVATLVCAYGGIVSALFLGQRRLLFRPDPARPELGELALLGVREVALTTRDGLTLLSWYRPPQPDRPVVLYLHGNGGHIGYRAERVRRLAAAGCGALMLEYRGYGGNPGAPSERGFYADADAAMAFLDGRGIAPQRVVVWGESLGSAVAVYLAARRRLAAVVLEAPFTSVAAVARRHYPFVPTSTLVRDRFDALSRIDRVDSPLLVLHGGRDAIVPIRFGLALLARAPGPKEGWFEPRAGHQDLARFGALEAALAFIERQLPTGAAGLVADAPNFA
jgi:fermentation-respiration switch protein FrsA (DUF1100 family)